MAHRHDLDATDRRLLRLLTADGRASYQALADQVGLSRPAVMERVKGMEEAGYISGYAARLDRAKTGYPVTAFVAVRYASHDIDGNEPAMKGLASHPGVLECHHVTGEESFILKVKTKNTGTLERLLAEVRSIEGVSRTVTKVVLSTEPNSPLLSMMRSTSTSGLTRRGSPPSSTIRIGRHISPFSTTSTVRSGTSSLPTGCRSGTG